MSLHEHGVGVLRQHGSEAPLMCWRFEDPPPAGVSALQHLQQAPVPPVGGGHVGLVQQPLVVRRDAVLRREDQASKVAAGDADALLREAGPEAIAAHWASVLTLKASRVRMVDLPGERDPAGRVL